MITEVSSPSSTSSSGQSNCCMGCGLAINEKYIYRVLPDMQWHESCLKCCECGVKLEENATCFIKNAKTYCKTDYSKLFAYKCDGCGVNLKRSDLVMKCGGGGDGAASSKMFHIDCFACSQCHRKLAPGDEYKLKGERIFCKDDAPCGDSSMPHLTSLLSQTSSTSSHHQHQTMMISSHPSLYLSYTSSSSSSSSSMPITPEYSNASVSSPSFSPTTTSSSSSSSVSSSSSIVDSPSSSSCNLHFSSNMGNLSISSSSATTSNLTSLHNGGFNHPPCAFSSGQQHHHSHKFSDMFSDFDYNIKQEEAESVSDDENNNINIGDDDDDVSGDEEVDAGADDDDSNLNESMLSCEESSFNESSGSFGNGNNDKSKKAAKKKGPASTGTNAPKTTKFKAMGNTSSPLVNGSRTNSVQLNNQLGFTNHRQPKPARIRTVLNEKQLQTLRACYNANPRPDAILKEHLVEITGLNPRVIRVWFQNKRCKDKKKTLVLVRPDQHQGNNNGSGGLQLPIHNPHHQFHMTTLANHHHHHHHQHGPLIGSNSTNNGFPQQQQQHLLYDNCF